MCIFSAGSKPTSTTAPEQLPPLQTSSDAGDLKLPKNKSTSNLLSQSSPANASLAVNTVRPRMSFDSGTSRDYDRLTRSVTRAQSRHPEG